MFTNSELGIKSKKLPQTFSHFTFAAGDGAVQWYFAQFCRNVIFPPPLFEFNSFAQIPLFPKLKLVSLLLSFAAICFLPKMSATEIKDDEAQQPKKQGPNSWPPNA